ncbi:MAG: homoserine dehydrogenase [Bryobacterales bacterium]|nr:homoserine dehydrogenase [Bryobacterales bacterium]
MSAVRVGIVGLGNVGGGTLRLLRDNAREIEAKLGFGLRVSAVCSRSVLRRPSAAAELHPTARKTADWQDVVRDPRVDVVAELVGGTGAARRIVETALAAGKPVVTANKELLAEHGPEIWARHSIRGGWLGCEAAVCGGIPVLKALREGIAGDGIDALVGILNGTSNFILTEIERTGSPFGEVLEEAQSRGYAEADPSADVDGYDARSKLAILAALGFGERVLPEQIAVEGIRRIRSIDFAYAGRLGHTIRLLARARREPGGLRLAVGPALVCKNTILASVTGSYNAMWVQGNGGDTFYYGKGAGPAPTGVAVVSDLMSAARSVREAAAEFASPFGHASLAQHSPVSSESEVRQFYLRFRVRDRPGVLASLASKLAAQGVSVDAVLQEPHFDKNDLPFVMTLEPAERSALSAALLEIRELDFLVDDPLALPMEPTLADGGDLH